MALVNRTKTREEILEELVKNGRHIILSFVLKPQREIVPNSYNLNKKLWEEYWSNFRIFESNCYNVRKKIYKKYCPKTVPFELFCNRMDTATENFTLPIFEADTNVLDENFFSETEDPSDSEEDDDPDLYNPLG